MRNTQQETDIEQDRLFLNHLRDLGLRSSEDYLSWCVTHGFGRRINKHWKQRAREVCYVKDAAAKARLRSKKRESRNPIGAIAAICHGRIKEQELTQPHLARFCRAVQLHAGLKRERPRNLESLERLTAHLYRCRANFFDNALARPEYGVAVGNSYLEALVLVATHCRRWIRPVEQWTPNTKNARRQFAALLRHLFAQYDDVPPFFDSVWFTGWNDRSASERRWYLHVASGRSIRTCKLPIAYTKKMAHCFMRAPDDVSVPQAIRWGQVHALGGDEPLVRALKGTRIGESFEHDDFWSTVIKWFVEHPLLDRAWVGPIIDYLHHQRFVPEPTFLAPYERGALAAPQPNLTMRGRSPDALLRQVHRWHNHLANDNTHQVRQWAPCGIEPFEFEEGSQQTGNLKIWTIRELLGSKALIAEGRQLKHCVATYATSCARRHCSIWTMELESFEGTNKLLTLEIHNQTRTICQARGKLNRLPTDKERAVLTRWSAAAGLRIASYV